MELLIFSCRTSGLFFTDMPSWGLIIGVMLSNVAVSFFAVYKVIVTPAIPWSWVANIWIYDIMWLVFIDLVKILTNYIMGNLSSDILEYVSLPTDDSRSSMGMRGSVGLRGSMGMRGSVGGRSSVSSRASMSQRMHDPRGSIRASHAPKSGSLRPSIPSNVAQHGTYNPYHPINDNASIRESVV